MSASTEITAANLIQTINGKLVVQRSKEFDFVNSQLEELSQHLEYLQINVVAAEQQDRKEYINQIKRLKASVQRLERLYNRLLFVILTIATIFPILGVWMAVTYQPVTNQSQRHISPIALGK